MARSPLSRAVYRTKQTDESTAAVIINSPQAPRKTTRLLLLVFLISAFRKLRNLSELLAPLTPASTNARLRALAGSADFTPGAPFASTSHSLHTATNALPPSSSTSDNISSTRWLWTQKHAWAGVDPKDESINAAVPPVSDEQSILLRSRLESLEVTLSLLDTVSDGVALFARLGITLALPFKALQQKLRNRADGLSTPRSRNIFQKLFVRAESLADIFWLLGTLISALHSEWERREVWRYGRRVRRLMREEETERDRLEREQELSSLIEEEGEGEAGQDYGNSRTSALQNTDHQQNGHRATADDKEVEQQEKLLENERRIQRIRNQRRTLRDLRGRLTWLWWDRLRLGADAIFALYDLFEWRTGSEGVRAIAGAISAGVGFSQVSVSHTQETSKWLHKFSPKIVAINETD